MEEEDQNPFTTPVKRNGTFDDEFIEKTAWKIRSSSPLKPLDQSLSDIDACSSVHSNVSQRYCRICFDEKDDKLDELLEPCKC